MSTQVKQRLKGDKAVASRIKSSAESMFPRIASKRGGKYIIAYFASWTSGTVPTSEIPWNLLTHIAIFAGIPTATGGLDDSFNQGSSAAGRAWAKGVADAAHANGVKVVLSLGGAGTEEAFFAATDTPALRTTFVDAIVSLSDYLAADQVDIDWEPAYETAIPIITDLGQRIRALRPGLVLSVPAGQLNPNWTTRTITADSNAWPAMFDQINCMNYGVGLEYGGWTSWASSPLYGENVASHPSAINGDVNIYESIGFKPSQIGVGMGGYGTAWTGVTGLEQTGGHIVGADSVASSIPTIMRDYLPIMTRVWDPLSRTPYLTSPTPKGPLGVTMISYEDAQSLKEKVAYVKRRGLGGLILWELSLLYVPGNPIGQRWPQLQLLADALASGDLESTDPAAAPTFVNNGSMAGTYVIPGGAGARYIVDGVVRAPGSYFATGSVTISAAPARGYTFPEGATTTWSWTYAATASPALEDDFSGDLSKWNASTPITVSGGTANIPLQGEYYYTLESKAQFNFENQSFVFRYASLPKMTTGSMSHEAFVRIRQADNPQNSALIFYYSEGTLLYRVERAGETVPLAWAGNYDPAIPWMRIREASGMFYFERSADGATWTIMGDPTPHSWSSSLCFVQFSFGKWDTNDVNSEVKLDYVRVQAD